MSTRSSPFEEPQPENYLVIGGNGFLGSHIVELLLARMRGGQPDGDTGAELEAQVASVRVFDLRANENKEDDVDEVLGDITKQEDLLKAMKDIDVVIHCVAPNAAARGANTLFYRVVVDGTQNVIDACQTSGVTKLVYTSTASVVFEGKDLHWGDESLPYPAKPYDYYAYTKQLAEQLVMKANGKKDLMTVSIRPHTLYGPRDAQLMPNLVAAAAAGKLKFTIGDGENLVDFTYVRNAAAAHIFGAQSLYPGSAACGKAFFVSDDQPMKFWSVAGDMVEALGYPRPKIHLPYALILYIALFLDLIVFLLAKVGINWNPTFNSSRVQVTGTHHYFKITAAKRDIGYKPLYSQELAFKQTIQAFEHLRKKK